MTKAARQILEACTSEGPEDITPAEMGRMVWGLAKTMPMVLDAIEDLRKKDAEQDEYIFIFKISKCALHWLTDRNHLKWGVAVLGVITLLLNLGFCFLSKF